MLKTSEEDAQNILRKLLQLPKQLAPLLQHVASGALHILWGNQVPNAMNCGQSGEPMTQGGGTMMADDPTS
jgi:hypothetical protein